MAPLKGRLTKVQRRLSRRRRDLEALREYRSLDSKLHAEGLTPPAEERIGIRIVWLAEVFDPGSIAGLRSGLEKYGLDTRGAGLAGPSERVRQSRGSRGWAAEWSLGTLVPKGSGYWGLLGRAEADLPAGVRLAMLTMPFSSESVTVVTCGFLFDEALAYRIDEVLRRPHQTQMERRGGVTSFLPPENAQREAVRKERAETRAELERWFSVFQGAFARGLAPTLPAVELMTHRTEAIHPLPPSLDMWPYSLDLPSERWRSERWPALFMEEGLRAEEAPRVLRLIAREQALLPRRRDVSGATAQALTPEEGWWLCAQQLNASLCGTFALWGIHCHLVALQTRLAEARDDVIPSKMTVRSSAGHLRRTHERLRLVSDARAVAASISGLQRTHIFKAYDGKDWVLVAPRRPQEAAWRWIELSVNGTRELARMVAELEQYARERLQVESQLFSSAAGLRVQRQSLGMAALAVLVAIAAVVVAIALGASTK